MRETYVETEDGRQGRAGKVNGLVFPPQEATVPPPLEKDNSNIPKEIPVGTGRQWFFCDTKGNDRGPITYKKLKTFVGLGVISSNTLIKNENGWQGLAGSMPGMIYVTPNSAIINPFLKFGIALINFPRDVEYPNSCRFYQNMVLGVHECLAAVIRGGGIGNNG